MSNQRKIQHLYLRSGFGESYSVIRSNEQRRLSDVAHELVERALIYQSNAAENGSTSPLHKEFNGPPSANRNELKKRSRSDIMKLNTDWLGRMASGESSLTEKMTLFWHGHFACRSRIPEFCKNYYNTLRRNALGSFGELLHSVSKEPAMLQFLNNQQNKKESPNENFARELMELFTIGRGNYTEQDVREAARAFTGWSFDRNGEFRFRKRAHDNDAKSVFGKTGNMNGDDVINILLEDKRTAEFITRKIYVFFVNDRPDEKRIMTLSEKFYASDYDIGMLMKTIFSSDWFYDDMNIGSRIKSPAELLAGLTKMLKLEFGNDRQLINLQRALGQVLFNPPNVGGWPGGRYWIDSGSLMLRLGMAEQIFRASKIEFDYKDGEYSNDDESSDRDIFKARRNSLRVSSDVSGLIGDFVSADRDNVISQLAGYLLQVPVGKSTLKTILKYSDTSGKRDLIESAAMRIMSLPEFQLC